MRRFLPVAVVLGLAWVTFAVFRPGFFSPDSIVQIQQAMSGELTAWHPPIMAITLRAFWFFGAGIEQLIWLQCTVIFLGAYFFALQMIGDPWRALAMFCVMLLPCSPLAIYAITFWKDAWAIGCMVWLCGILVRLSRGRDVRWAVALVCVIALFGNVRHNAIVVLPFVGLSFAHVWFERRPRLLQLLACAVLPVIVSSATKSVITYAYDVKPTRQLVDVVAADLVGMCLYDASLCAEFPLIDRSLNKDELQRTFGYGRVDLVQPDHTLLHPDALEPENDAERNAEFRHAILAHPLSYAVVKWRSFYPQLSFERTQSFALGGITDNDLGLVSNETWKGQREWYVRTGRASAETAPWRSLFAVHGVWLIANLIGLAVIWKRAHLRWLLCIPLAYYASYLLVAIEYDYRYMLPASVVVQLFVFSTAMTATLRRQRG